MMGKQVRQEALYVVGVSLEKRVREDHPLRRIARGVDFGFVRGCVAEHYGYNGNVSVDPEVVLKLMFLLFYYDVCGVKSSGRVARMLCDGWQASEGLRSVSDAGRGHRGPLQGQGAARCALTMTRNAKRGQRIIRDCSLDRGTTPRLCSGPCRSQRRMFWIAAIR